MSAPFFPCGRRENEEAALLLFCKVKLVSLSIVLWLYKINVGKVRLVSCFYNVITMKKTYLGKIQNNKIYVVVYSIICIAFRRQMFQALGVISIQYHQ